MFDNILKFFKKLGKKEPEELNSKDMAKERLHLVLMQDRANVSADFLDMMRQEIIDVIKKYIDVDDKDIDVRLTNKMNDDGTTAAPALYANIPITGIKQNLQNISPKVEVSEKEEKTIEEKETKKEESQKNGDDQQKKEEKPDEKREENKVESENKTEAETEDKQVIKAKDQDKEKATDNKELNKEAKKNKPKAKKSTKSSKSK